MCDIRRHSCRAGNNTAACRHVSLQSIANITAPVVVDGVKILEFLRVRGDRHSGAPELGWVRHQLRGSWREAKEEDDVSSSEERR